MEWYDFTSNLPEVQTASQAASPRYPLRKIYKIKYCPDWLLTGLLQIPIGLLLNVLNSELWLDAPISVTVVREFPSKTPSSKRREAI